MDPRARPAAWEERVLSRLLLRGVDVALSGMVPEPLFCRAALWDLRSARRLTQTFHFERNAPNVVQLLGAQCVCSSRLVGVCSRCCCARFAADAVTGAPQATFAGLAVGRAVVLIVEVGLVERPLLTHTQVYHVPSGDPEVAVDRYIKAKAESAKDKDK